MDNTYDLRLSRNCYYICLGICAVLGIAYLVLTVLDIKLTDVIAPCYFNSLVGLYCPGCGGTRAVSFLLQGNIVKSFLYHPVVPYTAVLVICYIISHTLNILTKGKVKAMLFRPVYFYLMIVIILLQCIAKNALIFINGTHILG